MAVITDRVVGVARKWMEAEEQRRVGRERREMVEKKKAVVRKVWTGVMSERNALWKYVSVRRWSVRSKQTRYNPSREGLPSNHDYSSVFYVRQPMLLPSLVHWHIAPWSEGWTVKLKEDRIFKPPTVSTRVYIIHIWICPCVGFYCDTKIKSPHKDRPTRKILQKGENGGYLHLWLALDLALHRLRLWNWRDGLVWRYFSGGVTVIWHVYEPLGYQCTPLKVKSYFLHHIIKYLWLKHSIIQLIYFFG